MQSEEEQCLIAFMRGEKEKALALLPKAREPRNLLDAGSGHTILYYATKNGWEDVVTLLWEKYQCRTHCIVPAN